MGTGSFQTVQTAYFEAIFDSDRERALKVVRQAVGAGMTPEDIVFEVVVPAIDKMVAGFSETFDTSIAQHFVATKIAAEITEEMMQKFQTPPVIIGRVVIGASAGDFHGLGKRIVAGCLKTQMIDVIDIGVNASAEKFVETAIEQKAQVIGIAAMMVHTACGENGCRKVRRLLQERGMESAINIVVGGAPYRFDHELYKKVQADAWAANGIEAGLLIKGLIGEAKAK